MIIGAVLFGHMAAQCAPRVAAGTLAAIAGHESGFNPLAIHDNTTGRTLSPVSPAAAIAAAGRLITVGHSIDLGLMQINSGNLDRLGLTVSTAFNACASLHAAGRLLVSDYQAGGSAASDQAALQVALSRYNTGSTTRGFSNGYVSQVVAMAKQVVPEIDPSVPVAAGRPVAAAKRPAKSGWDVFTPSSPGLPVMASPNQKLPRAPT
jgi:type IV secretion system protein VirB1